MYSRGTYQRKTVALLVVQVQREPADPRGEEVLRWAGGGEQQLQQPLQGHGDIRARLPLRHTHQHQAPSRYNILYIQLREGGGGDLDLKVLYYKDPDFKDPDLKEPDHNVPDHKDPDLKVPHPKDTNLCAEFNILKWIWLTLGIRERRARLWIRG